MGNKQGKPIDEKKKKSKKNKKTGAASDEVSVPTTPTSTETPAVEVKEEKAPIGPPEFYVRIARLFRVRLGDVPKEEEDEDERAVLDILNKPLADKRVDWADSDKEDMTALHWASYFGSHSVCKRLLELKADVNKQNSIGFTPLLFAARSGRELCGAILIEFGADINVKDYNGNGVGQWGNMRFFDALLMARFRTILDELEVHIAGPETALIRDIILDFIGSQEFDIDTSPPRGYGYELQSYEED